MKAKTIRALYRGECYPAEKIVPRNPHYRKSCQEISQVKSTVKGLIPVEKYDQLNKWTSLEAEIISMELEESFLYGFQLGSALQREMIVNFPVFRTQCRMRDVFLQKCRRRCRRTPFVFRRKEK